MPLTELETGAGFTVLTGETGAGKSILVDAIELLVGGRGDASLVREGAERAELSAEFEFSGNDSLRKFLGEAGLEGSDRAVSSGRSDRVARREGSYRENRRAENRRNLAAGPRKEVRPLLAISGRGRTRGGPLRTLRSGCRVARTARSSDGVIPAILLRS